MVQATAGTTSIDFDGSTVTISRNPKPGMSLIGAGDTAIPLAAINSVEWKPAGLLGLGHIRFSVAGSQSAALPIAVNRDPNAVAFARKQSAEFEKIRDTVRAALSR